MEINTPITKVISGGQTGVDRSALDFFINTHITIGGWCPKNRLAEDGRIPDKYPLRETASELYADRTKQNILNSDGTLVIYHSIKDEGTLLTLDVVAKNKKPFYEIDLGEIYDPKDFQKWMINHTIYVLNIAGPREGNSPGIYDKSKKLLSRLFL